MNQSDVVVCHLGRVPYRAAWALQQQVQARLIDAKRADEAEGLPHVVLVVEHPPVFTLGKSGDPANLLLSEAELEARGASFVPVDRGGDITFHGPGQLVVYPILDLDRLTYPDGGRGSDIHRYLRELEEAVILTCAEYGLVADRSEGRTGVWIGTEGEERKVCAMGVRCSRWVTMHGLAFNLNTRLDWFDLIVPCGIRDRGVTSIAAELERAVNEAEAIRRFLGHFGERFGMALEEHEGAEALAFLRGFVGPGGDAVVTWPGETLARVPQ